MRIAAIVPAGPGHQKVASEAIDSILAATLPSGWVLEPILVPDEAGELGRSRARNLGAAASDAPWLLFLDADDLLTREAFLALERAIAEEPAVESVHGHVVNRQGLYLGTNCISLMTERGEGCRAPMRSFAELAAHGPFCGIHVGHFVHRRVFDFVGGWLEDIDLGEDVEFTWACAYHSRSFRKVDEALAIIRIHVPSAGGRRGYGKVQPGANTKLLWKRRVQAVADYWRARPLGAPWTEEERRSRVNLYGNLGPRWREEPRPAEGEQWS